MYSPPSTFATAHLVGMEAYRRVYQRSIDDSDGFWREMADQLHWQERWTEPACRYAPGVCTPRGTPEPGFRQLASVQYPSARHMHACMNASMNMDPCIRMSTAPCAHARSGSSSISRARDLHDSRCIACVAQGCDGANGPSCPSCASHAEPQLGADHASHHAGRLGFKLASSQPCIGMPAEAPCVHTSRHTHTPACRCRSLQQRSHFPTPVHACMHICTPPTCVHARTHACRANFDLREGPISVSWFEGGTTNICYNALDRHVLARGEGGTNWPQYSTAAI